MPNVKPPERPFSHIPVRKLGTTEGYFYILPVNDIVCCVSTTLMPGESIVDAAWRRQVLPSSHIYVLSTKDTWVCKYRSLAEVERRLGPQKFLSTNRSTLVNVDKIRVINLREKPKLIGVEITPGKIELFPISRRALPKVRFFLGLPG